MRRQEHSNGLPTALHTELPDLSKSLRPGFAAKIAYRYIIIEIKL